MLSQANDLWPATWPAVPRLRILPAAGAVEGGTERNGGVKSLEQWGPGPGRIIKARNEPRGASRRDGYTKRGMEAGARMDNI
jgi:hypothetical protein